MAQYVGVNGVARKVTSPYIGVDGVARNVKNGYVGVDGVARLFFAPEDRSPVILEVEKIVSDTYANETTYTAEEFILLGIYPKTGGTVNVTYGGLTKTITDTSGAEEPNAQQVFFGTFNGVSDSVATPSSGELTIEGDYTAFGQGMWETGGKINVAHVHKPCITGIINFGKPTYIPYLAFSKCGLSSVEIPDSVLLIRNSALLGCIKLESVIIPDSVIGIGADAFYANQINALKTVIVNATTPPKLEYFTTNDDGTAKYRTFGVPTSDVFIVEEIIVPKGCGNAYKTAIGWSTYADYIVEAT